MNCTTKCDRINSIRSRCFMLVSPKKLSPFDCFSICAPIIEYRTEKFANATCKKYYICKSKMSTKCIVGSSDFFSIFFFFQRDKTTIAERFCVALSMHLREKISVIFSLSHFRYIPKCNKHFQGLVLSMKFPSIIF